MDSKATEVVSCSEDLNLATDSQLYVTQCLTSIIKTRPLLPRDTFLRLSAVCHAVPYKHYKDEASTTQRYFFEKPCCNNFYRS